MILFQQQIFRLETAYNQSRCTVNIMIPYRYAGFLFANRATFPKFVIGRESRRYNDRFELVEINFWRVNSTKIDIDKIIINWILLLLFSRQVQ